MIEVTSGLIGLITGIAALYSPRGVPGGFLLF